LDLGAYPDCILEVCSSFRLEIAKVEFLEIWTDSEILVSGSDPDSGSWSRSIVLNITCVQNFRSFGCGLIGFGIGCRIWKFQVL